MNWAPSAKTPLVLQTKVDIFWSNNLTFSLLTLSEQIIEQPWLNIKQHIESIVPLYVGKNGAEATSIHVPGQYRYSMVKK